MSEQTIRSTIGSFSPQTALPWFAAAGVYLLLIAVAPRLLADPDTYSHIALGRWILEHQAVPLTDPFSATFRGAHWVAFEWLSQVIFAVAFALGGWAGVTALAGAAVAIAFGLLGRFLLRELQPTASLVALPAGLLLTAPHILARPHVLALPVLVAWIGALVRTVDTRASPPWLVLPLMTLWANLHGSFTFGLAMIVPLAMESIWRTPRSRRLDVTRLWLLFALLAFAAACLNPYGPEMIMVTFRTVALGSALSTVSEWRPQDFTHIGSYELIILGAFGTALYLGVKLPLMRLLMLFGLLHLSLSQVRHADLLGMLGPMVLAKPLAEQFAEIAAEKVRSVRFGTRPAGLLLAVLLTLTAGLSVLRPDIAPAANISPAAAVHAFRMAKPGTIFNDYNFGGYLDFVGIAPFIDGRAELYGEAYVLRHARAVALRDVPDFLRLLDEYRIGATLLPPAAPAVALLDRLPDWKRIYADNVAVVHIRR
ncbi:MAG TPA: hypothetical protein VFP60_12045 [Pseudolabrys sp.]|nr:hypothetical protein [Pseudolabrys sp.]